MTILAFAPALATPADFDTDFDTADYSRPFHPSPVDEAFYLGFNLGLDGEDPATPEEFPTAGSGRVNRSFLAGLTAGRYELKRERDRIMAGWAAEAELEAMAAGRDNFEFVSDAELAECRGFFPSKPYDNA
jgi:hypothetical protein